ncbi:hypothetical protein HMPREF0381_1381 [Lachnoanaerobaculum saburreum DSM 3986]|uniref:Uncharacterized protein n=1 Tax=Lachnoanaerobaculum saburreum DSM 3986 TaxID=887325 RepID=E6LN46_9FIRM|nr:hypothetical protein HMPREF0381_1381 [Lachnoanaerobaculum saburreum DSM 3986]
MKSILLLNKVFILSLKYDNFYQSIRLTIYAKGRKLCNKLDFCI